MEIMYTILVIEDDEVDIMNIQRAFEKVSIVNPKHYAKDGLEALTKLKSGAVQKPLLILLDLNMPRMNGLEFLHELREIPQWKGTPVVVLTTSNLDKDRGEAYSMNVAGYVVKPIEGGGFRDAISTIRNYWSLSEFPPA